MTRRRFYAPPSEITNNRVTLSSDESKHLRDVLRLGAGDDAYVFDGEGREYLCVVSSDRGRGSKSPVVLEVQREVAPQSPESPLQLSLAVALLKNEKFDFVVQKATELGVGTIVPVMTKRADVRLAQADDAAKRVVRWQRLALEAVKQSGRARLPTINLPIAFAALIGQASHAPNSSDIADDEVLRLMFAEREGRGLLEVIPAKQFSSARMVTALVGPEGGWDDDEIAEARAAGWRIVTLGGRTLRAETAAIVVVGLMQHLCGDLN